MQVDGAAQLKLYWNIAGDLAINVYGCVVTGAVTIDQALADSLGQTIKSAMDGRLAPLMNPNVSLVKCGIRDLRIDNQTEYFDTNPAMPGRGTALDTLPTQVAICVTLRTNQSGKSFRGRSFIGGFDEAQNGPSGRIAPAAQTAAVGFVGDINSAALGAHGMALGVLTRPQEEVIITRTTNHANGTSTVRTLSHQTAKSGNVTAVTALESRTDEWETQRRRMNGRGVPPAAGALSNRITL